MDRLAVVVALALCLVLSACGESAEDRAQNTVCTARADIAKQVDELKGVTVTSATVDGVKADLNAIGDSLEKIAGARSDLRGADKRDVQQATEAFKSQVDGVTQQLGTSLSVDDAKQQIDAALQGLATSYEQALAPIDCS